MEHTKTPHNNAEILFESQTGQGNGCFIIASVIVLFILSALAAAWIRSNDPQHATIFTGCLIGGFFLLLLIRAQSRTKETLAVYQDRIEYQLLRRPLWGNGPFAVSTQTELPFDQITRICWRTNWENSPLFLIDDSTQAAWYINANKVPLYNAQDWERLMHALQRVCATQVAAGTGDPWPEEPPALTQAKFTQWKLPDDWRVRPFEADPAITRPPTQHPTEKNTEVDG